MNCEDYPGWVPFDDAAYGVMDMPPEARRVPPKVQQLIINAHRNLGHPSNMALVRIMSLAKCQPDMIAFARHMKCPACAWRQPPARIPRASVPYRPQVFNQVVGLDLKWIKDGAGTKYFALNILDFAYNPTFEPVLDNVFQSILLFFLCLFDN